MTDIDRVLVIRPYKEASISYRKKVCEQYGITDKQLNELIETGNKIEVDGKAVCFDVPVPEAYL